MTLRINWRELFLTDRRSSRNNVKLTWDVPHSIYRSTEYIERDDPGEPIAIIPPNQTEFVDTEVLFDTTYYYRIGELRPGGLYISEMNVNFMIKRHLLVAEAPFLAESRFGDGRRDSNGDIIPMEEFNKEVPEEWYWDGIGDLTEWLEYIVNGTRQLVRLRRNSSFSLGRISFERDDRNYPAAKENYEVPFLRRYYTRSRNPIRTASVPYWWPSYWAEVNIDNYPDSWNSFWEQRRNDPDIDEWYSNLWRL